MAKERHYRADCIVIYSPYVDQLPDFVGGILCKASTHILGQFHIRLVVLFPENLDAPRVKAGIALLVDLKARLSVLGIRRNL